MTGFGHADSQLKNVGIGVDVKTLNSRYLELKLRVPKQLAAMEPMIRERIRKVLSRGRVDLYLELNVEAAEAFEIDQERLASYLKLAGQLEAAGVRGELEKSDVLNLPGVIGEAELTKSLPAETLQEEIGSVVQTALMAVVESRRKEGEALADDLRRRVVGLKSEIEKVEQAAQSVKEHYLEKLRERLQEVVGIETIDENRLAQEVVLYVEKSDISEEIVRLKSHLKRFEATIGETGDEPVGKHLDFLCQELAREMNTILSKSAVMKVSELGLQGKVEIEKLREQVQNVE